MSRENKEIFIFIFIIVVVFCFFKFYVFNVDNFFNFSDVTKEYFDLNVSDKK